MPKRIWRKEFLIITGGKFLKILRHGSPYNPAIALL